MKKSIGARALVFPTPVFMVGTYDAVGKPNAMAAAWGGICCSKPPCVTVSIRKPRYTYASIVRKRAFTLSILPEELSAEADYLGMASGRNADKFKVVGLTPVKGDTVDAPYIQESLLVLECALKHTLELGVHTQFIGEITDVKAEESALDENGNPDIEKVRPMIYTPESGKYYAVGRYLGKAYSLGRKFM